MLYDLHHAIPLVVSMFPKILVLMTVSVLAGASRLERAEFELSVLSTMNDLKTVDATSILQLIRTSHPDVSFEEIDSFIRKTVAKAVVPADLHMALVQLSPGGIIDPRDEAITHALYTNPQISSRYRSLQTLFDAVGIWVIFCINKSRQMPEQEWCAPRDALWHLTALGMDRYINGLVAMQNQRIANIRLEMEVDKSILELIEDPKVTQASRLLAHNINLSDEEMSAQLRISLQEAIELRFNVLNDFVQPEWFLKLLLGYGGNERIDPHDPALIDLVVSSNASAKEFAVEGDVPKIIELWVNIVVNPLRTSKMDAAPVSIDSAGLVFIDLTVIQQYLAKTYL